MKSKLWYEALEVNPTSGYVKDEDESEKNIQANPISGYLAANYRPTSSEEVEDNDEDFGSVAAFQKPSAPPEALAVVNAPTFADALDIFDDYFDKINNPRETGRGILIPFGSGQFEAWWNGKEPDPVLFPDALPSPHRTITIEDVKTLAKRGGGRIGDIYGAGVIELFTQVFYNGALRNLPRDVLEYLVATTLRIGYNEDELASEGNVSTIIELAGIDLDTARDLIENRGDLSEFVSEIIDTELKRTYK